MKPVNVLGFQIEVKDSKRVWICFNRYYASVGSVQPGVIGKQANVGADIDYGSCTVPQGRRVLDTRVMLSEDEGRSGAVTNCKGRSVPKMQSINDDVVATFVIDQLLAEDIITIAQDGLVGSPLAPSIDAI